MVPYFPKQISTKATSIYLLSLATVSVLFLRYMMGLDFIIIGIGWVLIFFGLSHRYSHKWMEYDEKRFLRKLFITALVFRLAWVFISYIYYYIKTGIPFEFGAGDSIGYHSAAEWYVDIGWSNAMDRLNRTAISDRGYVLYLTVLYNLIGPNIIVTRILKALMSAYSCILIYRLAHRTFGTPAARIAGIFCCLMPNLIMYCGLHLKETEMLFLTILALERTDDLFRSKAISLWKVILVVVVALSLFTFRTVLGVSVIFAIMTAIVFSSQAVLSKWNRTVLIFWAVTGLLVMAGGTITNEAQSYWEQRDENQAAKRNYQVSKGVSWAKYATGAVMAPIMFVLPFPTMVDVDEQYNQQMINGGNYVRVFMGGFVLLALFSAIFVKRNWRDLSLIGTFVISYLGIICMSGFANSERFLLPGLPFLLLLSAYGVTLLNARNYKWVRAWFWIVPLFTIGWAVFKLGSRGIL